jgi:hypothetical protein
MSQSEFASLAAQFELADEFVDSKAADFHEISVSKQSAVLNHKNSPSILLNNKDNILTEGAQVHFITDELHAFIAGWESPTLTFTSFSDHLSPQLGAASVPVSKDMFKPNRRLNGFAPPKPFDRSSRKTKQ